MHRSIIIAALLSVVCCADTPTTDPVAPPTPASGAWVNPFDWALADPDSNPFADLRPEGTECAAEAHGAEELAGLWVYSIDTATCPWVTLRQPTALPAYPGDHIQASVWHFSLTAAAPATALVGFALAEGALMTAEEAIPGEARLLTLGHVVVEAIPTGTDLYFHLHNHGANSWHLVDVQLNPE